MNFEQALEKLLHHEGGYVNHPSDPGGQTNMGVTRRVYEEWVGRESSEKEMRNLTAADVAPIYKAKYWDRVKADNLPNGLNYAVFDASVNSGTGRAAKWLQECVGAVPDGGIGPKTLAMVAQHDPEELIIKYCDMRQAFLESLPTFETFGKGWTRRVNEVREAALKAL